MKTDSECTGYITISNQKPKVMPRFVPPYDHPDYASDDYENNFDTTAKCAQCGYREERHKMVRHHPSDLLICKTCIPAFVLELCDGDEINPTFEDDNGETI